MQNLSIDIGNTFTKLAVFDGLKVLHYQRFADFTIQDLKAIVEKYKIKYSVISTVAEEIETLEVFLSKHTQYTRFSTQLSNGVINKYKTPNTLGLDRWAVMLAAKSIFKQKACLVIDAGTCITYDLLEADAQYFGGSISPGINMRFKAMHHYTGRLPLINWDNTAEVPNGVDTITAMQNGVLQGVLNEIEGFIALNNNKSGAIQVILTGGDAAFLFKQLQNSIFAPQIVIEPYLVLKGLNEVIVSHV